MFYYNEYANLNVEDMINSYAAFKASRSDYYTDSIDNPWEWLKASGPQNDEDYLRIYDTASIDEKWLPEPLSHTASACSNSYAKQAANQYYDIQTDFDYAKGSHGEIINTLQRYVEQAVDEMDYTGSAIYEGKISKNVLGQIIDSAMSLATIGVRQLNTAKSYDANSNQNCWGTRRLVSALIESLVFMEIFGIRRPRYRLKQY